MRISRQSFDKRSGSLIEIISKAIPMARANWLSPFATGRLLLSIFAAVVFITAFSFLVRLDRAIESNKNVHIVKKVGGNLPPIEDAPRGLRSEPPKVTDMKTNEDSELQFRYRNNKESDGASIISNSKKESTNYKRKKLTPPENALFIAFYNLFISTDPDGAEVAIEVLTDQLGQVAASLKRLEEDKRAKVSPKGSTRSAVVFYNLIGNEHAFPPDKMKELCRKLHPRLVCEQINFYETASEAVTLHDIYEFCQNEDDGVVTKTDKDTRVVYLHSKGSYHSAEYNNNWRREMTNSVLHPHCLFPPEDRCDVCGTSFYTRFSMMFPGNMWTAKCSYIRKLLPPIEGGEYDELKKQSVIKFLKLRLWGHLDATLFEDRVDYFGLGRYRLEHWIGSHASVQPCELHRKNTTFGDMILGSVTPENYEWGMGPRRGEVFQQDPHATETLENNEDGQFREYYYLPGNLIKWFTLYGSDGVPDQNSWAWKFFPGGNKWKKLVGEYGINAIEAMVNQSTPQNYSAFSTTEYENNQFQIDKGDKEILSDPETSLAVFYHISFPEGKKKESILSLKAQLDILSMGQYDIVTRNFDRKRRVLLYFTTAGASTSNIEFISSLCKAKSKWITCRNLGDFPSVNVKGETLHQLHNFCRAQPSTRVTYLTNQLPIKHGVNKTNDFTISKVRAFTTAVTSKMCLRPRDTCNVCGMEFYPLPYNHFEGNMFTSTCEYINKLMPPEKFEGAMNDIAGDALISHLERAFSTKLFQFTPQNLGLDQYSVEHWIGSHPDFSPCDVAPVKRSWFSLITGNSFVPNDYRSSRVYDFLWSVAPRRSSAPPGQLNESFERKVRRKDDFAFREYFYLAGNLFRWYRLYNESPPEESWVWTWFPRGDDWRIGVEKYGPSVVKKLTEPYTDEGVYP